MPTINDFPRRKIYATKNTKRKQKIYQDKRWKKVRYRKFENNPVCEVCEQKGITSPTEEIHHIIPIDVDTSIAFKYDNLMSVCIKCHNKLHQEYVNNNK